MVAAHMKQVTSLTDTLQFLVDELRAGHADLTQYDVLYDPAPPVPRKVTTYVVADKTGRKTKIMVFGQIVPVMEV